MGLAEDLEEAQDRISTQEAWGLNTTGIAVKVLLRAVRALWTRTDQRLQALEARVDALENQPPP